MIESNLKLAENSAFQFTCRLCGNCCRQMLIRLTPFDIINLAGFLDIKTYDFINDYVVFLKAPNVPWLIAALKHVRKGECMFKQGRKCKVHDNRPLPCRLFPVGRKESEYVLHKISYCKGLKSEQNYTLSKWLEESKARPFLEMSQEFYALMKKISDTYNLDELDPKREKMFYKLLYDYDSASLESTVNLVKPIDKAKFSMRMAEWFLEYTLKFKELSDDDFLTVYEKQALQEEKKLLLNKKEEEQ